MPRTLTPGVEAEIAKPLVRPFHLFEVVFDDVTVRNTDAYRDIVFASGSELTTAVDSTANGNDGTLKGGPMWTKGVLNQALSFDHSTTWVSVPDADELSPSVITVEAWILPIGTWLEAGNIVAKGGNGEYRYRRNIQGTITFFDRGATNAIISVTPAPLDTWTHVAIVGDASGLKIYINGNLDSSNAVAYGAPNGTGALLIGAFTAVVDSEIFLGKIDDVRIWNVARTQQQIQDNKDIELVGNETGLVGYWKLNQGHTFTANGHFVGFEDLSETSGLELSRVRCALSGVDQAWISDILTRKYIGRQLTIWRGFFDDNSDIIIEPYILFQGPMDEPSVVDDPENGESIVSVIATNDFAKWDEPNGRRTNDAEQQLHFPGDKAFEFVTQINRQLRWGRRVIDTRPRGGRGNFGAFKNRRTPGDGGGATGDTRP